MLRRWRLAWRCWLWRIETLLGTKAWSTLNCSWMLQQLLTSLIDWWTQSRESLEGSLVSHKLTNNSIKISQGKWWRGMTIFCLTNQCTKVKLVLDCQKLLGLSHSLQSVDHHLNRSYRVFDKNRPASFEWPAWSSSSMDEIFTKPIVF